MKINELIEKLTEALRGAIKGGRLPRSIVFDSIADLSQALLRAKAAHSDFERGLGAKDDNWPLWYAAYIAMEQGLVETSASKLTSSAIEVSAGSENAPPLRLVRFLHLRPVAVGVWHEFAVTFGGPRRRMMICRMLRYLVITATLFYYSKNIVSTSLRTLLGGSF
jgi:hypothetical protein